MGDLLQNAFDSFPSVLFGNDLMSWLTAVAVFAVALFALGTGGKIVVGRLRRMAEKTVNQADDLAVDVLAHTQLWFLALVAAFLALRALTLGPGAGLAAQRLLVIGLFIQVGVWCGRLLQLLLDRYTERKGAEDPARVTVLALFGFFVQVAVWLVVFILSLENLGVDVTALIAGLGLGGIAVGLALQNVLKDTFASLSIMLDKPFEVGDFIIVGEFLGTVEKIGIKTTRVRSLGGEQLIFGNDDLLVSRIRNYKRMSERRALFSFGVVYQTPADTLKEIPRMVQEIVEGIDQTRFDRAHFKAYGASSLDFEVVYFILAPEYNLFMDIQQTINLEIYRRFESAGIQFAYPTRTIYLQGASASEVDQE